jgi:hypothetical protein
MYVSPNFRSKKALREAWQAGKTIDIYQPNNIFGTTIPQTGSVSVEGPHFPEPHRWYATIILKDGKIILIK